MDFNEARIHNSCSVWAQATVVESIAIAVRTMDRAVRRRVEMPSGQPVWHLECWCGEEVKPTSVILSNGETLPCTDGDVLVVPPPPGGPSGSADSQALAVIQTIADGAAVVVGDVEKFFHCEYPVGPLRCPDHLKILDVHTPHKRGQQAAKAGDWGYVLRQAAADGCRECCQRIVNACGSFIFTGFSRDPR